MLLLDLHTGFSGGRLGHLVFPSLSEVSLVCCDPHKDFSVLSEAEVDVFQEFSCIFYDLMDVGNVDLWFPCLFYIQLEHLEILGSHTVKA